MKYLAHLIWRCHFPLFSQFPITALREIRILQLLKHENVVNLIEICYTKASEHNRYRPTFYLVFDFCEHDLAGLLANINVKFNLGEIKKVMQQLLNGLYYIHFNKVSKLRRFYNLVTIEHIAKSMLFSFIDFTSWLEGSECSYHKKRCIEIGGLWIVACVQSVQKSLHKWCGDVVVSAARTAARRTKLWSIDWYVGRRMHHGWNVDTFSDYAREKRTTTTHTDFSAVRFTHTRCKDEIDLSPLSFSAFLISLLIEISKFRYGQAFKIWNITQKSNYPVAISERSKIVWWHMLKIHMAAICWINCCSWIPGNESMRTRHSITISSGVIRCRAILPKCFRIICKVCSIIWRRHVGRDIDRTNRWIQIEHKTTATSIASIRL